MAPLDRSIPPNGMARALKQRRDRPSARFVIAIIAQEDVGHLLPPAAVAGNTVAEAVTLLRLAASGNSQCRSGERNLRMRAEPNSRKRRLENGRRSDLRIAREQSSEMLVHRADMARAGRCRALKLGASVHEAVDRAS